MLTLPTVAAAIALNAAPAPALTTTPTERLGRLPPGLGVAVGSAAPDAVVRDLAGKPTTLKSLYLHRPTLVVFYRGGWCPWCNLQLHALAAKKAAFDQRGLAVVAVSVDQPTEAAKTNLRHTLPFTVLSDSTLAAHEAFRVVHHASEGEVTALKGFGADLEAQSGERHHSFAVPALFLISREGVVLWAHADEDFKTRPSVEQLLEQADRLLTK